VPAVVALGFVAPGNASADIVAANPAACLAEAHWAPLASFSHATALGYNWADADPAGDASQMLDAAQMHWAARAGSAGATFFARRAARAALGAGEARAEALKDDAREGLPNFLMFYEPGGTLDDYAATPRDLAFLTKQLVAVRGGEPFGAGPADTYFAFKGIDGENQSPRDQLPRCANPVDHNDMDAGSFVFDAAGARFALDLGYDNYGLLGYFSTATRYDYYRKSTAGHNTLQIDGANQRPCEWANFTSFNSTAGLALGRGGACGEEPRADPAAVAAGGAPTADMWAVLELSRVTNASGVARGFIALDGRAAFATVDEFPAALAAVNVTWTLHINGTAAVAAGAQAVSLTATTGATAALAVNAAATDAACVKAGAFSSAPVVLGPVPGGPGRQQFNTTGLVRVIYTIDAAAARAAGGCARLTVVMTAAGALPAAFAVAPLAAWASAGPFA